MGGGISTSLGTAVKEQGNGQHQAGEGASHADVEEFAPIRHRLFQANERAQGAKSIGRGMKYGSVTATL